LKNMSLITYNALIFHCQIFSIILAR